ncbi:RAD51-associated protein 1-like isoform X2 [Anneissia japonica]|nr:RAD51-associated protein 1-like isoform X2 [Anneissia japonica]
MQPAKTKPTKEKKAKEKNVEQPVKRDRVSLEKLEEQSFERELRRVMELSKQESQGNEKKENKHNKIEAEMHNQGEQRLEIDKENKPSAVTVTSATSVPHPQLNQNFVTTNQESGIEVLEEDFREDARPSRRAASRKSLAEVYIDDDDDGDDDFYVGDVDNGSDGNFSDDGDESDYEISTSKKKNLKESKKKTVKNKPKENSSSKKSKATSGKSSKNKASPANSNTSSNIHPTAPIPTKRAAIPATIKTIGKGFTPPATSGTSMSVTITPKQINRKPILPSPGGPNPLGGVKLISPGQPRRLGLSRFARVKPLHNLQLPT